MEQAGTAVAESPALELPSGLITDEEARRIYRQGEEAVAWAILTLAKERNELARERDELKQKLASQQQPHPSTPSGMVPVYKKSPVTPKSKKQGRKKGHPGTRRGNPENVRPGPEHTLKCCPKCGGEVSEKPTRTRKRIIEDSSEVKPEAMEHTIHGYWCGSCEEIVEPVVPDALPGSTIGNHLLALTAWLHYGLGQTLSQIVEVLNYHLQFRVSPGGLVAMWYRLQAILYGWYEQIGQEARRSAVLHADETGWRVAGVTHWLWCFTSRTVTYYMIDRSRGEPALKKFFLEMFEGTLVTDFWGPYEKVKAAFKQKCFVHLFRELKKVDLRNNSPGWGVFREKLKRLLRDALRLQKRQDVSEEEYASRRALLDSRLGEIYEGAWEDRDARRLAKRLRKYRSELFVFLGQPGVSADNNHGEREIRPAVIIRKNSLCNRSQNGADMQAVLMSVYRTLKLRGLNPIQTISAAVREYLLTGQLPPLPPAPTSLG